MAPGVTRTDSNLTRSQHLIWLGQRLQPDVPLYNMAFAVTLQGALDTGAFRRAFERLINDVDALRTVFVDSSGGPRRRVLPSLDYALPFLDFSDQADPDSRARRWVREQVSESFTLSTRLFDAALIELCETSHVWYINQHHLITDGWSIALLHGYLAERYALELDGPEHIAATPPSFEAYANYEQKFRTSETYSECQRYWQEKLDEPRIVTDFYGRSTAGTDSASRRVTVELGGARSAALRVLGERSEMQSFSSPMTLFSIFAAALLATLHRIGGQHSLRLGTPFHNRPNAVARKTIGQLIEIGALHVRVEPGETFLSLINKVQTQSFADIRYARPGMSSAECTRSFDVLLNYINASLPSFADLCSQSKWLHAGHGDAHHALCLQVHDFDGSGTFQLSFDLNEQVFDTDRETWLIRHFLTVIDWMIEDPSRAIGRGSLMTPDQSQALLVDFNQSDTPYPKTLTVVELFEAQVKRSPDKSALSLSPGTPASPRFGRAISYAALNGAADKVAGALVSWGVAPETIVGICLERSIEAVVAILGTLKSGATYLPLDPELPESRITELLADSGCRLLLTRQDTADRLGRLAGRVCCLDTDWTRLPAPLPRRITVYKKANQFTAISSALIWSGFMF